MKNQTKRNVFTAIFVLLPADTLWQLKVTFWPHFHMLTSCAWVVISIAPAILIGRAIWPKDKDANG